MKKKIQIKNKCPKLKNWQKSVYSKVRNFLDGFTAMAGCQREKVKIRKKGREKTDLTKVKKEGRKERNENDNYPTKGRKSNENDLHSDV